jgi:hypothetical protein
MELSGITNADFQIIHPSFGPSATTLPHPEDRLRV